jgi:hypothetical protein
VYGGGAAWRYIYRIEADCNMTGIDARRGCANNGRD